MPFRSQSRNRVLNAAKSGHSADPVSAVTKKGKTLLGVDHPIDEYGGTINVGDEVKAIKKSQNSWHLLPIFMLFPLPILAMFYDREQSDVLSILQSSFSMICNKAKF